MCARLYNFIALTCGEDKIVYERLRGKWIDADDLKDQSADDVIKQLARLPHIMCPAGWKPAHEPQPKTQLTRFLLTGNGYSAFANISHAVVETFTKPPTQTALTTKPLTPFIALAPRQLVRSFLKDIKHKDWTPHQLGNFTRTVAPRLAGNCHGANSAVQPK